MYFSVVSFSYKIKFRWLTLIGIISFGVIVPTFYIPMRLFSKEHLSAILASIAITSFIWEGSKFAQAIVTHYYPWEKSIVRHLLYEILYIFLFTTFVLIAGLLIFNSIVLEIKITPGVLMRNLFVAFALALLFTAINEGAFLFNKWKTSLVEQERLKKENVTAKLESLKKQLDPHFLFNSLSVLSSLIYKDPMVADSFISKLSKVYRYVLDQKETSLVPLDDELQFVDDYFFLMKMRFQTGITLKNKIITPKGQRWLPPLSIQLLIENAIKHNKILAEEPLDIVVYEEKNYIWVVNKKNLRNRENYDSTNIGLRSLETRYEYLSDRKVIRQEDQKTFRVGLPLLEI